MKNLNVVVLTGRFGRELELKKTQSGKSVLSASIAVNGWKEGETHWIELQAWEKPAEIISQYCSKGSKITVQGELKTSSWETQDGTKRYKTYVLVSSFEFMGEKPKSEGSQNTQNTQDDYDDDIPF